MATVDLPASARPSYRHWVRRRTATDKRDASWRPPSVDSGYQCGRCRSRMDRTRPRSPGTRATGRPARGGSPRRRRARSRNEHTSKRGVGVTYGKGGWGGWVGWSGVQRPLDPEPYRQSVGGWVGRGTDTQPVPCPDIRGLREGIGSYDFPTDNYNAHFGTRQATRPGPGSGRPPVNADGASTATHQGGRIIRFIPSVCCALSPHVLATP